MQPSHARFALLIISVAAFVLSSCVTVTVPRERDPAAEQETRDAAMTAVLTPAHAAAPGRITIYAPSTASSVPVILAAQQFAPRAANEEGLNLTIFDNHSQANTLFLRGDVDMLVTGLSVGLGFFRNGAPIQVINCNVSGLTYLVTRGLEVRSFTDLRGESLYLPFEGSPIEEITRFFAEQEGLIWGKDIKPVYSPLDSSLAMLTQGKAAAVVLPEPYVSLAERQAPVAVSIDYRERWDALTGSSRGYPQVCTFVKRDWADAHRQTIARFNAALADAIRTVQRDPAAAAASLQDLRQTGGVLGLTPESLLSALHRTEFDLRESDEMQQEIRRYYEIVGKPLDASYDPFFYR